MFSNVVYLDTIEWMVTKRSHKCCLSEVVPLQIPPGRCHDYDARMDGGHHRQRGFLLSTPCPN